MSEILKLNNVSKDYGIKGFKTRVLNSISLSVYELSKEERYDTTIIQIKSCG